MKIFTKLRNKDKLKKIFCKYDLIPLGLILLLIIFYFFKYQNISLYGPDSQLNLYNSYLISEGKIPIVDYKERGDWVARLIPALFIKIFGLSMKSGYLASMITNIITTLNVLVLSKIVFNRKTAYFSMFLFGFSPSIINFGFKITQVTYFHFFFSLFLLSLFLSIKKDKIYLYILSGLLLGLVIFSYRLGAMTILTIPIILLYAQKDIIKNHRKFLRKYIQKFFGFYFGLTITYILPLWYFTTETNFSHMSLWYQIERLVGLYLLGLIIFGFVIFVLLILYKKLGYEELKINSLFKLFAYSSSPIIIYLFLFEGLPFLEKLKWASTAFSTIPLVALGSAILFKVICVPREIKSKVFYGFWVIVVLTIFGYLLPFSTWEGYRGIIPLSFFIFSFFLIYLSGSDFFQFSNDQYLKMKILGFTVFPYILVHLYRPTFHVEYIMYYSIPAVCILSYIFSNNLKNSGKKLLSKRELLIFTLIAFLLFANLYSLENSKEGPEVTYEDKKEIIYFIKNHTEPGDEIISTPLFAIESERNVIYNISRLQIYKNYQIHPKLSISNQPYKIYPTYEELIDRIEEKNISIIVNDKPTPFIDQFISSSSKLENYVYNNFYKFKENEKYEIWLKYNNSQK